ncbi:MAG TPA: hypothetical protein PLN63_03780 [Paludibacteraceae bacterium]|jgi:hypothetical protein|nr:hypothetical protein [Paludibacteraceae bacterium]HOU69687.1 hypothetical protein [Paludibacteraceae bacterium]HPH62724.1 hypothetical protein [Paludibacteraceae bacterium]HQF51299.1 hypothetical protein [Paludibacteraceae bacterium]HQJ89355.1 hypothetical protein [Paludibacteraceae bacterium]
MKDMIIPLLRDKLEGGNDSNSDLNTKDIKEANVKNLAPKDESPKDL